MTILIADSGSTKTHWCLQTGSQKDFYFQTEGYNPYYVNRQYILNSIYQAFPCSVISASIDKIFFYGAGCSQEKSAVLSDALKAIYKTAEITVLSDLMAAARGLLQNSKGFVAILGTGTNSGIYDSKEIIFQVDSLGFMLGDEGSGGAIGKRICSDYIRRNMPEASQKLFRELYKLSPDDLLENIYAHSLPNRYCADFCRFLSHPETDIDYVKQLVRAAFESFFHNIVSRYQGFQNYQFNCCGSVAFNFKDILSEVAAANGMTMGTIEPSIIKRLADFHQKNFN